MGKTFWRVAQAPFTSVAAKKMALVESVNPNWEDLIVEKTDKSRPAARDRSTSVGMTEEMVGNTDKSESGNGKE